MNPLNVIIMHWTGMTGLFHASQIPNISILSDMSNYNSVNYIISADSKPKFAVQSSIKKNFTYSNAKPTGMPLDRTSLFLQMTSLNFSHEYTNASVSGLF